MKILMILAFSALCSSFDHHIKSKQFATSFRMAANNGDVDRWPKQLTKVALGIFAGFALSAPDFTHNFGVAPVVADFRAQQKSTFFRFAPKFTSGRDFYRSELKNVVESGNWDAIKKFFEVYPSKINRNDPNQVDAYDSYVNLNFYRPMKVLAGSFAERGTSTKQRALTEQEVAFETAMAELEGCVKDRKGEGFFAQTIKMPTGEARKKQAKEAYANGMKALDEYVRILNEGLMLELNKIPL